MDVEPTRSWFVWLQPGRAINPSDKDRRGRQAVIRLVSHEAAVVEVYMQVSCSNYILALSLTAAVKYSPRTACFALFVLSTVARHL